MRSGQLAAAAGVNLQTLRYYERLGLLPEPERSLGGHRNYGQDAATILRIVKAAQRLGFTLEEIKQLLAVGSHQGPRPGLRQRAQEKLTDVETKIAALHVMRTGLINVLNAGCADLTECSCVPDCPIPFPELATSRQTGSTRP